MKNVRPATFGDRIRVAREEIGMSQTALARAVGVSPGSIGNYEAGTRDSSRKTAALAKALKVSSVWLESGAGPMRLSNADDDVAAMTPLAHALSQRQPIVSPRTLVWEDLVTEDVQGQFIMAIVGDALAPDYLPGQSGIWEAGAAGRAGKPVLLVDTAGAFYLRLFEPRAAGSWAGVSQRVGHRELTPERDGVRVLARLRFLDLG